MFIDHGHHSFLIAHLWATETHCAPDGATEVCLVTRSINIAPPRGWKEIKMKIGRTSFLAVALFMAASANLQTE